MKDPEHETLVSSPPVLMSNGERVGFVGGGHWNGEEWHDVELKEAFRMLWAVAKDLKLEGGYEIRLGLVRNDDHEPVLYKETES